MTSYWKRFNFRIKHQLYLRILPVVGLSVLAVGAFSARLLTSRAVRTFLGQETMESTAALRDITSQIGVQALSAEVEREVELKRLIGEAPPAEHGRVATGFLQDLLALDGVRGAALVHVTRGGNVDLLSAAFAPDLSDAANLDSLRAWAAPSWRGMAGVNWVDLVTGSGWPGGPHISTVDNSHALWIFDPIAVARRASGADSSLADSPASPQHEVEMLLPLAVHEQALEAPRAGAPRTGPPGQVHIVLLLDVRRLLQEWMRATDSGQLQAAVDQRGRLICASSDTLAAGMPIASRELSVLRGVEPTKLSRLLERGGPTGVTTAYLGSRLNPYATLIARRPELPVILISALELSKINGGLVLYAAIIALMVTIALLGSVLAITSVGERLSNRLQSMSHNMEEVAKGDFTRRMGLGSEDEVGRLISYFNQMTADLEEATRQVSEKTHGMRVALDKMKRLDKAKDDFLALISHEVRTPLTSIIGGIDYLRVIMPAETEQRQLLEKLGVIEIIEIVENSGRRLSEFMNDAILMASLQSQDIRIHLQPAPVGDICGMVLSSLQETIAEKSLTVENELAGDLPWAPLCDRELMTVAFDKLLRNAVQHNFENGRIVIREADEIPGLGRAGEAIEERVRGEFLSAQGALAAWTDRGVQWRSVLVFNTGPVIPLDKREALFTKFELVGRIEHHQKGSGLSLPIMRAVLENHGGGIHVESVADDGNYFYLIFPTITAPPAAPPPSRHEQRQRERRVARDEEVDGVGNASELEVELEHVST